MKIHRTANTMFTILAGAATLLSIACASAPKKQPEAAAPVAAAAAAPAETTPPAETKAPAEARTPAETTEAKPHETPKNPLIPEATKGGFSLNPAADDPLAAPWLDYNAQPPDGQWLVDLEGREYFVVPVEKQEGFYTRTGPNRVRLKFGIPLVLEREDDHYFYAKVFRTDEPEYGPPGQTGPKKKMDDYEKEKIAKSYLVSTPESDELSFTPIGAGLPTKGQWRNGFALADVDGDGALDLVHGPPRRSLGGTPVIYRGDGKGGFTRWDAVSFPPYPYDYGDAAAGDFNRDGKIDLAFAIHLRGVVAMLGDGKGNFTAFSDGLDLSDPAKTNWSESAFTSRAIEVVDWNRDGRDDLIAFSEGPARKGAGGATAYTPGKRIYLAGPKGWTKAEGSLAADSSIGDAIALGDFNADKKIDFVTSMSQPGNKAILNRAGAGTTFEVSTIEGLRTDAILRGVAAADVNGDRRDDIFVSWINKEGEVARSGIDLMLTQPGGWLRIGLWGRTGRSGVRALADGDLDGDGKRDIVGFTDDGEPVVLKGQGNGKFTLESPDGFNVKADDGCAGYGVALADLDRDGRDEIVAGFAGERCATQGSLRAWKATRKTGK